MSTSTADRPYDRLLLDFGTVCLVNPAELHDYLEDKLGLARGTLAWRGPLDPDNDPLWQSMLDGTGPNERGYWIQRSREVGELVGKEWDLRDYMAAIYVPARDELVRDEATEVVDRTLAAGIGVSVLTNDLSMFHGPEWQHGISFLDKVDHIVDCSNTEFFKPDPRAYALAVEVTGTPAERMLFVDDQPGNVAGAEAFGIDSIYFDVRDPEGSWEEVARRIGVASTTA